MKSALLATVTLMTMGSGMIAASAQTLTLPAEVAGASMLPLNFSPATEEGDRISYFFEDQGYQSFEGPLQADLDTLNLAGPSDQGAYSIIWSDVFGREKDRAALDVDFANIWMDVPASATSGETMTVNWQGPGFKGDRLFIYRVADDAYLVDVPLTEPSPAQVPVSVPAGSYELLYWYDATKTIMVRQWFEVL